MVSRGERPPKPVFAEVLGLTPALWELTIKCWHRKAAKRPNTSEVLARLEGALLPTRSVASLLMHTKRIGGTVLASPSLLRRAEGLDKGRPAELRPIQDQDLDQHSLTARQRDAREEFPVQAKRFATVSSVGSQERQAIFPQAPSFLKVLQGPYPDIQKYIDGIDDVCLFRIPCFRTQTSYRVYGMTFFQIANDKGYSMNFANHAAGIARSRRQCISQIARRAPWRLHVEVLPLYGKVCTKGFAWRSRFSTHTSPVTWTTSSA